MDVALFDNKIDFTLGWYKKNTNDMLLPTSIPVISGFTNTLTNIGEVRNKGVEFNMGYQTSFQEFNIRTSFNISANKNEIKSIDTQTNQITTGGNFGPNHMSRPGNPIAVFWGFKTLGIFDTQEQIDNHALQQGVVPGSFIFQDTDGNGVINPDDMVQIGDPHPNFVWGFNLNADYKRFDVSMIVEGAQGFDIYRQVEATTLNMDGVFNILEEGVNRWRSAENPGNGKIPTSNDWRFQRDPSTRFIYSGSNTSIRNLTIGYTLPIIGSNINDFRIFTSVDNLLIITNYPGNNPNVNQFGGLQPGVDDETFPLPRIFSFGAELNF